ncbi:MAG: adenylate/guanylate cyclase domain-containing protein [Rhizobiales bacterium]|nr:adenylate/guanylate cyclase domain-containing protein [Hyphomicrobiales bacterium]
MAEKPTAGERAHVLWQSYLTGDTALLEPRVRMARKIFAALPSPPRCRVCFAPFRGLGGRVVGLFGFGAGKSRFNPTLCDRCEKIVKKHQVGAEVEMTLLFADIRGSTTLAEKIGPTEFHHIVDRFYRASTDILVDTGALIDKLVGDEVVALYAPGIAGEDFARRAIGAARRMLLATGHGTPEGPWLPVGIGIHTGRVYVGAIGSSDGVSDITVLGDPANTAARLASQAGPGEVLVGDETCRLVGLPDDACEKRRLQLKGRAQPADVHVVSATEPVFGFQGRERGAKSPGGGKR